MRILFHCNTYYQLIVALQMRHTLFKDDEAVLVLSDHSKDAITTFHKLEEMSVFSEMVYMKTREVDNEKNVLKKIQSVFWGVIGSTFGETIKDAYFDAYLYYNDHVSNLAFFAFLLKKNPNIKAYKFEESLLSYGKEFHYYKKQKTITRIRKILHKRTLIACTSRFYCFKPEWYAGELKKYAIPTIDEADGFLAEVLKRVYFENEDKHQIKTKYIFLTSIGDDEGGIPIGEYEIVEKVAEVVGMENLTIKIHPRMDFSRYRGRGYNLYKKPYVPWEAVQLNQDLSDKVLLSVSSSSILSVNVMIEHPCTAFYFYPLSRYKQNYVINDAIDNLETLFKMMERMPDNIFVIKSWEEFEKRIISIS